MDYDYLDGLELRVYQPDGHGAQAVVVDSKGEKRLIASARKQGGEVLITVDGPHKGIDLAVYDGAEVRRARMESGAQEIVI